MNLVYKHIVNWSPQGGTELMQKNVSCVSSFVEKMKTLAPAETTEFLKETYELMNGKHFNASFATAEVAEMHHFDKTAGTTVHGEIISMDEVNRLIQDMPHVNAYDAYVGFNGFMHDLANTGASKSEIVQLAKHFWFEDDDFCQKDEKVWWYYSSK